MKSVHSRDFAASTAFLRPFRAIVPITAIVRASPPAEFFLLRSRVEGGDSGEYEFGKLATRPMEIKMQAGH
jgi:hypothetical protein